MDKNKEYLIDEEEKISYEKFMKEYAKKLETYEKPSVTVDMLIFTTEDKKGKNGRYAIDKELKLLLIKRKDHPFINSWALPGGFVNMQESMDEAAYRELLEETGIKQEEAYLEQLYTFGEINRDPRTRVISSAYIALTPKDKLHVKAGDDAIDAKWFIVKRTNISVNPLTGNKDYFIELLDEDNDNSIIYKTEVNVNNTNIITKEKKTFNSITPLKLAFDHVEIIDKALDRLKNKVEYTPIAFTLLSEKFTLTELQKIYEIILEKPLHKSNFRRKINDMVIETNSLSKDGKSKLFTFNKNWNHVF